jgi:hypothetical protein
MIELGIEQNLGFLPYALSGFPRMQAVTAARTRNRIEQGFLPHALSGIPMQAVSASRLRIG